MGAEVFTTYAKGTTAKEAFDAAVEQAQYDYGHAGYTGTIAEKAGWVMVADAPMTAEAAGALANKLIGEGDERIDDKWGPAGCIAIDGIAIDGGGYLFFGWASS